MRKDYPFAVLLAGCALVFAGYATRSALGGVGSLLVVGAVWAAVIRAVLS